MIIVEDIVDTGLTLSLPAQACWPASPASLEVCTLLPKADQSDSSLVVQLHRVHASRRTSVVGYGLDVAEQYRNLVDIHLHEEVH